MKFLDNLLRSLSSLQRGAKEPAYFEPLRQLDYAAAVPLLQKSVQGGEGMAMAVLATLYAFGRGVEQSPEEAAAWYRQSAVRGYPAGQAAFGVCLAGGIGVVQNDREAAFWLYKAGMNGQIKVVGLLSDIVTRDQSVIGEHFSMADFMALVRRAHRVASNQPCSG